MSSARSLSDGDESQLHGPSIASRGDCHDWRVLRGLKSAVEAVWEWAGLVDDIKGRVGVLIGAFSIVVGGVLLLLRALGAVNTVVFAIGAAAVLIGVVVLLAALPFPKPTADVTVPERVLPEELKPPLQTTFTVERSTTRSDDVVLFVRAGVLNRARFDVTEATLNFLVPDAIQSMDFCDIRWNVVDKGIVDTTAEYPAHGGQGPSGSLYWSMTGARLNGRVSSLFHFRLIAPKESASYPVLLRIISQDLPHPYEVTGNIGVNLPELKFEEVSPSELTPYTRLGFLFEEGEAIVRVYDVSKPESALVGSINEVANWRANVRRELDDVAPQFNQEWRSKTQGLGRTAKSLPRDLEVLSGILSRLK